MAVVKSIEPDDSCAYSVNRTEARCTYAAIASDEGILFDLRTYGSDTRSVEGHASQIMQFDKTSARQLYRALRATFDFD